MQWLFIIVIGFMATNAVETRQRAMLSCKKYGSEHKKPVGNKLIE